MTIDLLRAKLEVCSHTLNSTHDDEHLGGVEFACNSLLVASLSGHCLLHNSSQR